MAGNLCRDVTLFRAAADAGVLGGFAFDADLVFFSFGLCFADAAAAAGLLARGGLRSTRRLPVGSDRRATIGLFEALLLAESDVIRRKILPTLKSLSVMSNEVECCRVGVAGFEPPPSLLACVVKISETLGIFSRDRL